MVDVKIKWQPIAIKHLVGHYQFLSAKNERAAITLYNSLRAAPNILFSSPCIGQIEPLLSGLPDRYRYLLVKRMFKIIYTIKDNVIEIHAVWDCRQSESKLKKTIK